MDNNNNFYPNNNNGNTPVQPQAANGFAIASLVVSVISLLGICCTYFGFIFGVVGIVLAILSKKGQRFSGIALAGLIISAVSLIGSVVLFIISVKLMTTPEYANLMNELMKTYPELFGE